MAKTRLKHMVKAVRQDVVAKSVDTARVKLNEAKAIIDKAAKKGVIHKKSAARKISRLSRMVNTLQA
jgi:small subunit ribosomal protein S20